jgi:hypothetical protein
MERRAHYQLGTALGSLFDRCSRGAYVGILIGADTELAQSGLHLRHHDDRQVQCNHPLRCLRQYYYYQYVHSTHVITLRIPRVICCALICAGTEKMSREAAGRAPAWPAAGARKPPLPK